ncbi:MAG: hypothetical protein HQK79_08860 [Desulfobacterales bacterium]|nr:hypothetical protein [Desulfobacterales bacterium]MBF0398261.1 hypothetical protein [Desulfobacterales bacterium]
MEKDYIHQELNQEITAIGGHYNLVKENILSFDNRNILYILGCAIIDTSCCGKTGLFYGIVPGFIVKFKYKTTEEGLFVSIVDPVCDNSLQEKVKELIKKKEKVHQVIFLE